MRIAKFMAHAGAASRRACEDLIREGRVRVNGSVISDPAFDVDPETDSVYLGRKKLTIEEKKLYLMFNKPSGCVSTCSDDKGRKTVLDYIDVKERIYPVGRLDFNSEGLLLITNDGDLANRLTHPSHEVDKRYFAVVRGDVSGEDLAVLSHGVVIDGRKTAPAKFRITNASPGKTELTVAIHEGRNRQIRKMFEAIGKEVIFLKRISVGKLVLGELKKGKYRELTEEEVTYLRSL